LKKKDQLLESYQTPTSLQQMSISTEQQPGNPAQPTPQSTSQQGITPKG